MKTKRSDIVFPKHLDDIYINDMFSRVVDGDDTWEEIEDLVGDGDLPDTKEAIQQYIAYKVERWIVEEQKAQMEEVKALLKEWKLP